MDPTIIVALITLAGVIISAFVTKSNISAELDKKIAIIETKIDTLEQKVEKHNNTIERTYNLETRVAIAEADISDIKDDLHANSR